MPERIRIVIVSILALLCLSPGDGVQGRQEEPSHTPDVVYVGTPYDVVSKMLKLAKLKKDDVVFDLGCGDGRMLVLAAMKYGCRGFGYDIDPERVGASRENARRNGVEHLVRIAQQDLFALDLSPADVLSLYLLPDINKKLLPKFEKLKPGTRLVFHDYGLEGIEANEFSSVLSNEDGARHTLYLYTTPLKHSKSTADK